MAVYYYKHEWCGMDQEIFLEGENRNTISMPCYRCGRNVVARQIRDKSIKLGSADGTVGILRREKPKDSRRGESGNVR